MIILIIKVMMGMLTPFIIKRDKESLRQKQKEVESMGNRHIKERQNINKVIRDIFEGSLSL